MAQLFYLSTPIGYTPTRDREEATQPALDENDVQEDYDNASEASYMPEGEDAITLQETDQWDVLQTHHAGVSEMLWEIGKNVIHQSSTQFRHGATSLPACVAASSRPSTRASTQNYKTMAIKLHVSCKRCLRLRNI